MITRVGSIWGIEPKVLIPGRQKIPLGAFGVVGRYNPLRYSSEYVFPEVLPHEDIHAITHLISPPRDFRRLQKGRRNPAFEAASALPLAIGAYPHHNQHLYSRELIAELSDPSRKGAKTYDAQRLTSAMAGSAGGLHLLLCEPFLGPARAIVPIKALGREAEMLAMPHAMNRLYDRHGMDGLIAFSTIPPRTMGAAETLLWARGMWKKGYFEHRGGLTEAGEEFLRRKLPRETILDRLKSMR